MTLQPSPLIELAAYAIYTPTLYIKKIEKHLANLSLVKKCSSDPPQVFRNDVLSTLDFRHSVY